MNKEYIYVDEKAIIRDENGEKDPIKYYNELDKFLEKENLIETMENKIKSLEKEKKGIKNISVFSALMPMIFGIVVLSIIFIIFSLTGLTLPYNTIVDTIFGPMTHGAFMTSTAAILGGTVFGFAFTLPSFLQRAQDKKHLIGLETELNYLEKSLHKEKEKLEELNKNKNYEHKNKDFRIVKINNEAIKNLNSKLKLYYSCGYNGKKYYKYYKKHNQLPKELIEMFKSGEIEIIKEFLEEKGPQLIKRK